MRVSPLSGSCSLRDLAGAWRSPGFLLRASSLTAPAPAPNDSPISVGLFMPVQHLRQGTASLRAGYELDPSQAHDGQRPCFRLREIEEPSETV